MYSAQMLADFDSICKLDLFEYLKIKREYVDIW